MAADGKGFILTMWYVNVDTKEKKIVKSTCFILTMWYVNDQLTAIWKHIPLGFILTMWYVNWHNQDLSVLKLSVLY